MSDCFRGAGIAFDLDGTLVDTAPDLVRALNAVVAEDGLEDVALSDVRAMVGRGARVLIERAYSAQERRLAPELVDAKVQRFIDVYKAGIADLSESPVDETDWFEVRLRVEGQRIQVTVGGKQVVEYVEPANAERSAARAKRRLHPDGGALAIQAHDPNSVFYFRRIRIRELP